MALVRNPNSGWLKGAGIFTTPIAGGAGVIGPAGTGGAGDGGFDSGFNYKLTAERLEEWQWFQNFLNQNPDIKERYAVHKTYEILKDKNEQK